MLSNLVLNAPVTFAMFNQENVEKLRCVFFFFLELTHPWEQPEHKFVYVPAQPVPVMIHDSEMLRFEVLPR